MGYTGKEEMRFKERYINEFHEMKNHLRNNVVPMNEKESLIALMKLSAINAEETEELKTVTKKNKNEIEELIKGDIKMTNKLMTAPVSFELNGEEVKLKLRTILLEIMVKYQIKK